MCWKENSDLESKFEYLSYRKSSFLMLKGMNKLFWILKQVKKFRGN